MSFSVHIQIAAHGARTVAINGLKSTDTIADLVQKLVDKEGLDQDKLDCLMYRGKPLSNTSKQLKDVGIKSRSFLFVAFKVQGGGAYDQDIENFINLVCFLFSSQNVCLPNDK